MYANTFILVLKVPPSFSWVKRVCVRERPITRLNALYFGVVLQYSLVPDHELASVVRDLLICLTL